MSPHILEALISGGIVAGCSFLANWLQNRDTRTRLILKVEELSKDVDEHGERMAQHESTLLDHGQRIVRLETKVEPLEHSWGRP